MIDPTRGPLNNPTAPKITWTVPGIACQRKRLRVFTRASSTGDCYSDLGDFFFPLLPPFGAGVASEVDFDSVFDSVFDSLLLSLFDSLAGLSFSAAFLYDSLR